MNWSSSLLIFLFLALWLAPVLAIKVAAGRGWRPSTLIWSGVTLYLLAFLGLALWWRVPFAAQNDVESAATSWAAAPRRQLACSEVEAAAAGMGRASRGQIGATATGDLRMPAGAWRRLPERERAALIDVAAQMRRCLGGGAAAQGAAIYDIETNSLLFESGSTPGR